MAGPPLQISPFCYDLVLGCQDWLRQGAGRPAGSTGSEVGCLGSWCRGRQLCYGTRFGQNNAQNLGPAAARGGQTMICLILLALGTGFMGGYYLLGLESKSTLDLILMNALNVIVFIGGLEIGGNKERAIGR